MEDLKYTLNAKLEINSNQIILIARTKDSELAQMKSITCIDFC